MMSESSQEECIICHKPANQYVLDGGALLHRVAWPRLTTFYEFCLKYCQHVTNKYGRQAIVVFDGHDHPSTKSMTRQQARSDLRSISRQLCKWRYRKTSFWRILRTRHALSLYYANIWKTAGAARSNRREMQSANSENSSWFCSHKPLWEMTRICWSFCYTT